MTNLLGKLGFGVKVTGPAILVPGFGTIKIDEGIEGKIVIVSGLASRGALEKMGLFKPLGVIVSSCHFRDFEVCRKLNESSFLLLQGFGFEEENLELTKKLEKLDKKKVTLDPEKKTVYVS